MRILTRHISPFSGAIEQFRERFVELSMITMNQPINHPRAYTHTHTEIHTHESITIIDIQNKLDRSTREMCTCSIRAKSNACIINSFNLFVTITSNVDRGTACRRFLERIEEKKKKREYTHVHNEAKREKESDRSKFSSGRIVQPCSPGGIITQLFENLGTKFVNFDREPKKKINC